MNKSPQPKPANRTIAVLVRAMEGGGAQRDAILLAGALAGRHWRVKILSLHPEGPLRALVAPGIEIVPVAAHSLKAAIPAFRRLFMTLAPSDVVLSSEAAQNAVAFLAHASLPRSRRPKLLLREVASPSLAKASDPYVQNRIAYRFLGAAYARCDRAITLTEGARADLAANFGVPLGNIEVMGANAVLDRASEQRLRGADLQSGREPGLIVCVGRLSAEKDQVTLVEAFARLPDRSGARLVLVGEGPLRGAIEETVRRLGLGGRVALAGFDPDPLSWLLRAELAVCSSRFEGFGNAIVEALACGTPVVSTDCPFGPREILEAGRFGRLVPPGDAAALAAAILATLGAPVERGALRRHALKYTGEAAALELERIISGLAG